jgi:LysR family glycine cleavage system transcriptional activator
MPIQRPPPLRSLRAFCAAARHRSFKLAADELFVTPSAISHQMKELETRLEVLLFERRTRSLELTHAGEALLEQVEPLLLALDRAVSGIARGQQPQSLRVAMPPFFASELFVPRLASFYRFHPALHIRIDSTEAMLDTHAAACDASILLVEEPPAELHARKLLSLRLCAVGSPELAGRTRYAGSDLLQGASLIVHRTMPHAWATWAAQNDRDPPDPDRIIELDSQFAVARAAEQGLGAALLPTTLSHRWFRSGALVRLEQRELVTAASYFFVVRPEDADRAEIRALTYWALRELGHIGAA